MPSSRSRSPVPIYTATVCAIFAISAAANAVIIFDDGLVHTIDTGLITDDVRVTDSQGGASTTLNLGGDVEQTSGEITLFDSSILSVSGSAALGGISAIDDSDVTISGGTIDGKLAVVGDSYAVMTGGDLLRDVGADSIFVAGRMDISGGVIGGEVVSTITGNLQAVINISGGHFFGRINTNGGIYNITGGEFFNDLLCQGSGSITIIGSSFNFPFGDIIPTSGTLTGILADGTPLDVDFFRHSSAMITLPEPSALAALGPGIAMLALLYRRRRHSVER